MIIQKKSKRTVTGSTYKPSEGKRKHHMGRDPAMTMIGQRKIKVIKTKGSGKKQKLFSTETANILDKKTNKYIKAKIKAVIENPANRFFIRRNIITKGAIIDTEKGKARVTSRPGQDGTVNAVLIS